MRSINLWLYVLKTYFGAVAYFFIPKCTVTMVFKDDCNSNVKIQMETASDNLSVDYIMKLGGSSYFIIIFYYSSIVIVYIHCSVVVSMLCE